MQIYLQDAVMTKTDWATDVQRDEAKRNRASQEVNVQCGRDNFIHISSVDALRGNTRPHPEHDG